MTARTHEDWINKFKDHIREHSHLIDDQFAPGGQKWAFLPLNGPRAFTDSDAHELNLHLRELLKKGENLKILHIWRLLCFLAPDLIQTNDFIGDTMQEWVCSSAMDGWLGRFGRKYNDTLGEDLEFHPISTSP